MRCGQALAHLVYRFVLTYSNWESVTICFSESLESLSEGLQNALWELGGVPVRHRSDRLSGAVNNLSDYQEFTQRYEALLGHYGLAREKINARQSHENGDMESSHRHCKEAVEQALLLRGSREFPSRASYAEFLRGIVVQRNTGRTKRLAEERPALRSLPAQRREACRRIRVRVSGGSILRVQNNTHSIHSRLIGEEVDVRIDAEHFESIRKPRFLAFSPSKNIGFFEFPDSLLVLQRLFAFSTSPPQFGAATFFVT